MRRASDLVRFGSIALVSAAIFVATLHPFEWVPPRTENGAAYLVAGGIEFRDLGIAHTDVPPPWLAEAITTHKLEIVLALDTASDRQQGPARILTLSQDIHHRNLTIGQENRDLVIRLRTPGTDNNGIPPIAISEVFGRPGWVDIRITIEPARVMTLINDEVASNERLPSAPLSEWDPSYRLALGNELTGDRPWLGKIRRALVSAAGGSIDYAVPGTLEVPQRYWLFHRRFNFVPLTQTSFSDCLSNFALFIPLGFVLGFTKRRTDWRDGLTLLLLLASISMVIETLQLGFAGRYPSLNDILFNTIGGMVGVALARWLMGKVKGTPARQFGRS